MASAKSDSALDNSDRTGGSAIAGDRGVEVGKAEWPELTYLDIGEIVDAETDETIFDMSSPDEKLGERACLAFNCHAELVAVVSELVAENKRQPFSFPELPVFQRARDILAKARAA